MDIKRAWVQLRMLTLSNGIKRADYLRRKKVFGCIGEKVMIQSRKVPIYPELIYIGNNVRIASDVCFITHDVVHNMINNLPEEKRNRKIAKEKVGRITIGNNVFIGANTTLLYDVCIGDNVIIGAGSLVNKDIQSGVVAAGVPCKVIGSFDDFVNKRVNA